MEPDYEYASDVFEYGTAVDSPSLYFVTITDINQKPIKVGFQSFEVTIRQLINNYLEVTPCREFMSSPPCFKIVQHGPYFGELAIQTQKFISYGLSLDSPCFFVDGDEDSYQESQKKSYLNQVKNANKSENFITVTIQIQNFQKEFKINLNQSLRVLKQRLIKEIDRIQKENPANLYLMKDGLFIVDENALMKSYGITAGMKIRVTIMKKQGCFRRQTKILAKENNEAFIDSLKVGDQLISYNEKKESFQQDKITFIHTTKMDQFVVIELSNGILIESTANHLFLCEDNIYRKVNGVRHEGQSLQIGNKLKLFNGVAQITSIHMEHLPVPEEFYHLCIENNHNFIVNGAICHNLFVNIIIPNGDTERVNIQPNEPFSKIKEYFEQFYHIQMHNQRLLFAGRQILDHETMTDRNIPKQSNIYLKFKNSDDFNLLYPLTPILTFDGKLKAICEIKQGENVAAMDPISKKLSKIGDVVVSIVKRTVKQKMTIKLNSFQQEIVTSADCYIELQNGQAINVKDLCYHYDHGQWPSIRKIDGQAYKIKEIAHELLAKPMQFYKFILSQGQNYVANSLIVNNLIVNIVMIKNGKRYRKLSLGVSLTDKILYLKQQVSALVGIAVNNVQLTYNNQLLENEAEIIDYNIKVQHIITANSLEKVSKSSLHISDSKQGKKMNVKLYLQLSENEKIPIDYDLYKIKTVEEIMREFLPNYESSYFFLFADLIIYPHDQLSKIQMSQQFGDNTIIVVKNQKLAFIQNMNIQGSQVRNSSYILLKKGSQISEAKSKIEVYRENKMQYEFVAAAKRIAQDDKLQSDFRTQKFYLPFLYFTSRKYSSKIFKYIKRFDKYKKEVNDSRSEYSIIKDLYVNMNMLKNYQEVCYFGMKNFKFSRFFQKQHTFYWHSFIIAHQEQNHVKDQVMSNFGTLFVISSMNGKKIKRFSLYPQKKEILFAPFTYFMVEKIEKNGNYDKVWLSQVSSPVTFQKNIVLWVDDEPKGNGKVIAEILKTNDIEILQVTSTVQAEKWVKQFGWLLNWKGLQFKLISDMKRVQNGEENKQAGIDLLERLYKVHGISAQTLIFCGHKASAQQRIKIRNIPRERYYSITIKDADVVNFCKMKNK